MIWLLLLVLLLPEWVGAQNHSTLRMINPLPSSASASTGRHSSNRIYRAHPGIEYRIMAAAAGGSPPYTWSITSGAPSGMSIVAGPCTDISCRAGLITWPNPQSNATNVVVRATDRDGDYIEATYSITVSTTGFYFVSPSGSNGAAGTLAAPWQTIQYAVDNGGANNILVFRAGTYDLSVMTTSPDNCGNDIKVYGSTGKPAQWVAYPGESVTLDMDDAVCVVFDGSNVYVEGFTVTNCENNCFRPNSSSQYGAQVILNTFDRVGPGVEGANSGHLMYDQDYGNPRYYHLVSHNTFTGGWTATGNAHSCIKIYSWTHGVVQYNYFYGNTTSECLAPKSEILNFLFLANTFKDTTAAQTAMAGNMDDGTGNRCTGEYAYNNVASTTTHALKLNHEAACDEIWVYRNTLIGVVEVWNLYPGVGPFTFANNVIVNAQYSNGVEQGYHEGATCPVSFWCNWSSIDLRDLYDPDTSLLVSTDNLRGVVADSITDADGLLQGSYRTSWLGTRGWELGGGDTRRFSPRLNLIRSSLPQHTEELN